jgi:aryl-alcohol dehydrogenase-like predicted oxidoreductase
MSAAQESDRSSFTHRFIPAFGKKVHRFGLVGNYGLDEAGIRGAMERGLNYLFYNPLASRKMTRPVIEELARDRERYVLSSGPTLGFFGGSVRRSAEKLLRSLKTDYLDLFQLYWLGKTSAWTDSTVSELVKLKESGKARSLGISIHDRQRAGKLAEDSPLDVFMIRYNASHPGAEKDIFPHLERRKPAIVAYTATDWRKLLARPSGWSGPVPTAGDCYRFCLSSPHVDLVLCGAASLKELDENLRALEKGPLDPDETRWMREFGQVVSGKTLLPSVRE